MAEWTFDEDLKALVEEALQTRKGAENPKTPSPMEDYMSSKPSLTEATAQTPPMQPPGEQQQLPLVGPPPTSGLGALTSSFNPRLRAITRIKQLDQTKKAAQAADDAMRVAGSEASLGGVENLEARIEGVSVDESFKRTEEARARLGSASGPIGFAGAVAPYMLMSMPTSIGKMILTGGGLGAGDAAARKYAKGEDLDPEEIAISALFGAGSSAIGAYVGRGFSGLIAKFSRNAAGVMPYMTRAVDKQKKIYQRGAKMLDRSGVELTRGGATTLFRKLGADASLITPANRRGNNMMRYVKGVRDDVVRRGGAMTLREIAELRKGLEEFQLGGAMNEYRNTMVTTIEGFIDNLPRLPGAVARGDVATGVEGFNTLNRHYQRMRKLDLIASKVAIAESIAATHKSNINNALRDQFSQWITTKTGRAEFKKNFSERERKILLPLAKGDITTRTLTTIDQNWGKGTMRFLSHVLSKAGAPAAAARQNVRGKFSEMPSGKKMPYEGAGAIAQRVTTGAGIQEGREYIEEKVDKFNKLQP